MTSRERPAFQKGDHMTSPNLTEIICVIDRSGSMGHIRSDAIGGFNTFLEEQKRVDKPCKFTYVQFDDVYEMVHNGIPIRDMPPLNEDTYVPRGMTALHDAIGRTICTVGERLSATPERDRPGKVLFVILTDGVENFSKEYNLDEISKMITHQREKYNWEFVFLAANQDAFVAGRALGIQYNANFTPDSAHVNQIYCNASAAVMDFRMSDDISKARNCLCGIQDAVVEHVAPVSTTTGSDEVRNDN